MALCHDVTDDLKKPVPVSPSGKYLDYREMIVEMDRQTGLLIDFLKKAEKLLATGARLVIITFHSLE